MKQAKIFFGILFLFSCSAGSSTIRHEVEKGKSSPASPPSESGTSAMFEKKEAAPSVSGGSKTKASGLKAGYADDNEQFNYFLNFLEKYSYAKHYPTLIQERIKIQVTNLQNQAIPNCTVEVKSESGRILETGLTYSDGTYLLFPLEHNANSYQLDLKIENITKRIQVQRNGARNILAQLNYAQRPKHIPMDIVFVLDTTGSMGGEIAQLLQSIELIHLNLSSLEGAKIRFGMVLYKDKNDEYITKIIQPTENVKDFKEELAKVVASGGGDMPEDLQTALRDVVREIQRQKDAIRLGFIITDAPPHLDYGQDYEYPKVLKEAKSKGIKFYSIGTGGLNLNGEYVLRQISQYTYAKYIFLTYGEKGESEGGRPGSVSHHTGENFPTDKLESIIIRFAKEEYFHANGKSIPKMENYFTAMKVETENREDTLQKLFEQAASQLIDFSTTQIETKTPSTLLPIIVQEKSLEKTAFYFEDQMTLSLSKNPHFQLLERKNLKKLMEEWKLSQQLGLSEENAIKAGRMLGAKLIFLPSLHKRKNDFEMYIKLLNTETGEILSITKMYVSKELGI